MYSRARGDYDQRAKTYFTRLKGCESMLYKLRERMKERNEDDDEVFEGKSTFRFFQFRQSHMNTRKTHNRIFEISRPQSSE